MDAWTVVVSLGVIIGIIAGVVQVLDYIQKHRERSMDPKSQILPSPHTTIPETPTSSDKLIHEQTNPTIGRVILPSISDKYPVDLSDKLGAKSGPRIVSTRCVRSPL